MLIQLQCLQEAAKALGLPCQVLDRYGNLLAVSVGGRTYHFSQSSTDFVGEGLSKICLDKEHSYQILHEVVRMPYTVGFLDPAVAGLYSEYQPLTTIAAIVQAVEGQFSYPMVIKRNRGAQARHVFCCHHRQEAETALRTIFNAKDKGYDYVALAQTYVPIRAEYRVVFFRGRQVMAYERYSPRSGFNAKGLQHPGSEARLIGDASKRQSLQSFMTPVFDRLPLQWAGVDILEDERGEYYLLELNSAPRFSHLVEHAGKGPLVQMYQKILGELDAATS